jgi:hypothetical protein
LLIEGRIRIQIREAQNTDPDPEPCMGESDVILGRKKAKIKDEEKGRKKK